jgi:3-phosphoglycerate kinase
VKNADDIRTDAIALLVEKLREIEAKADQECKRHREAEKSLGSLADFYTFCDHREAAALNYALAYRCEQLAEEITGALLFDELDAQDEAADQAARDAEDGAL